MPSITLRGPQPARVRRQPWRAARADAAAVEAGPLPQYWRTTFFEALAETSNVRRACYKAGVSAATVYDLKRRDTGFEERWLIALAEGYDNLEMELLDRLRNGESGEVRYNYPAAVRALQVHRDSVGKARGRRKAGDIAAARASLLGKLEQMRTQLLEGAAANEAGPTGDSGDADAGQ